MISWARTIKHKTGYNVWIYGRVYWHRTLKGAKKRTKEAQGYCDAHAQIVSCSTGERIKE